MSDYMDFKNSLLGLFANDLEFRKELPEVQAYYEFYEGRRWTVEEDYESTRGQLWGVRVGDYTPTREIRNLTKKLLLYLLIIYSFSFNCLWLILDSIFSLPFFI